MSETKWTPLCVIGTAPTCYCGKPSAYLLRVTGSGSQLAHYCAEHGKTAIANGARR